jgi:hypothetical protein
MMDEDLQVWTVRAFDDASARVALPTRERWIPVDRKGARSDLPVFAAVGAGLVVLAIALWATVPGPIDVGAPKATPTVAPTLSRIVSSSEAESGAWGTAWTHAAGATVLRPTWLPEIPGQRIGSSIVTSSLGLESYSISYAPLEQGFDPRLRQAIFILERPDAPKPSAIQDGGAPESVTVQGHPAELVGNGSGALQLSWMQGGYRYAIQSAQLTRAELLRIAESLTPVVAADGALASAEVTMCSRTAYGGTVVGAFTLRAGDLAAQDETRGGASGPHPLRSGFRDYPSDTPIVLCFLDGFIAAPGGPPPIPPATFRPYDRFVVALDPSGKASLVVAGHRDTITVAPQLP